MEAEPKKKARPDTRPRNPKDGQSRPASQGDTPARGAEDRRKC